MIENKNKMNNQHYIMDILQTIKRCDAMPFSIPFSIKRKINISDEIEEYLKIIHHRCEKNMPDIESPDLKKKQKNEVNDGFIPTFKDYHLLITKKYNNQQLKSFAKYYNLKLSGNKNELTLRLYIHLKLSCAVIHIQRIGRGYLQKKYNKYHGPAYMNRSLCTNNTDFMTMDDLKELPFSQFFSYKDVDNFIYGFDILSLYNLIINSGKTIRNPYNRNKIQMNIIKDVLHLIRLGQILKIKTDIVITDIVHEISPQKNTELRILKLFQTMDNLGNYSNPIWFSSLDKPRLITFLKELNDIFVYRAQLTDEVKRNIYPPHGSPFRNLSIHCIHQETNIEKIKNMILDIMENFVYKGIDKEYQTLGSYYVLGALSMVSPQAASSMPWLYQSFV